MERSCAQIILDLISTFLLRSSNSITPSCFRTRAIINAVRLLKSLEFISTLSQVSSSVATSFCAHFLQIKTKASAWGRPSNHPRRLVPGRRTTTCPFADARNNQVSRNVGAFSKMALSNSSLPVTKAVVAWVSHSLSTYTRKHRVLYFPEDAILVTRD
jgi:hypothetical protein